MRTRSRGSWAGASRSRRARPTASPTGAPKKDRVRWIEFRAFHPVEGHPDQLRVDLITQHGTYVKEVLSGEGAVTVPSLAGLLELPCRCLELDVLAILDAEGEPEPEYAAPKGFGAGL